MPSRYDDGRPISGLWLGWVLIYAPVVLTLIVVAVAACAL